MSVSNCPSRTVCLIHSPLRYLAATYPFLRASASSGVDAAAEVLSSGLLRRPVVLWHLFVVTGSGRYRILVLALIVVASVSNYVIVLLQLSLLLQLADQHSSHQQPSFLGFTLSALSSAHNQPPSRVILRCAWLCRQCRRRERVSPNRRHSTIKLLFIWPAELFDLLPNSVPLVLLPIFDLPPSATLVPCLNAKSTRRDGPARSAASCSLIHTGYGSTFSSIRLLSSCWEHPRPNLSTP